MVYYRFTTLVVIVNNTITYIRKSGRFTNLEAFEWLDLSPSCNAYHLPFFV